jgi:hypothetical protein
MATHALLGMGGVLTCGCEAIGMTLVHHKRTVDVPNPTVCGNVAQALNLPLPHDGAVVAVVSSSAEDHHLLVNE